MYPACLRGPRLHWPKSACPLAFSTGFQRNADTISLAGYFQAWLSTDGPMRTPRPDACDHSYTQLTNICRPAVPPDPASPRWSSSPLPHIFGTNFLVSPNSVQQTSDGPSDIPIPAWCERSHRSLIGICHLCPGQARACFGWCPFVCPYIYGANSLAEYCSWASPCTLAFCTVMGASCSSLNTVRIALGNREIN